MTIPIKLEHLKKRFGFTQALRGLDLEVPKGAFTALFGPNGAGKTTAIKTLLNIYSPDGGRATVLGTKSTRLTPAHFQRIGYVSENQELPEWMTVDGLIHYCRPMYPTWDQQLTDRLKTLFKLPGSKKLGACSRGMRMKAALLSSLAYRPELVVLDEPFSGLDPLARDQFIDGLLELSGEQPFSLLISSHDVSEVERLCDTMAFLDQGKLELAESVESLQKRFKRIEVSIMEDVDMPPSIPSSWRKVSRQGGRLTFVETAFDDHSRETQLIERLLPGAKLTAVHPMALRDIVVALSMGIDVPDTGEGGDGTRR